MLHEILTAYYRKLGSGFWLYSAFSIVLGILEVLTLVMLVPVLWFFTGEYEEILSGQREGLSLIEKGIVQLTEQFSGNLTLSVLLLFGLLLFFLKAVIQIGLETFLGKIRGGFVETLKGELFHLQQGLSWRGFVAGQLNDISTLINENVTRSVMGLSALREVLTQFSKALFYILVAALLAPIFGLTAIVLGVVIFSIFSFLNKKVLQNSQSVAATNKALSEKALEISDLFEYLKITQAYDAVNKGLQHSIANTRAYERARSFYVSIVRSLREPLAIMAMALSAAVSNQFEAASLSGVTVAAIFLYRAVSNLNGTQVNYQNTLNLYGSYIDVLTRMEEIEQYQVRSVVEGRTATFENSIEVVDLNFSYQEREGRNLIENLSFTIGKGEIVSILGPSGAGKSTLVRLLLGIEPPTSGRILLDNTPVNQICPKSLGQMVGFVPQNAQLQDESLRHNLSFRQPEPASDIEMHGILARLGLGELSGKDGGGLDTKLGKNGAILSGGQRQRVMIARELLRNIKILVLDEPSSAIDGGNTRQLARILQDLRGDLTVLLITHDIELGDIADKKVTFTGDRIMVT